jgi:uncharacterized membrane protein
MAKSAAFGVVHLGIAFSVSYALSGSLAVAGAVTVVEPICNTVAHYFFDRWWSRRQAARSADLGAAMPGGPAGVVAASS